MDKYFGEIKFETEHYCVLDKRSGILSTEVSEYIVHRLDRDTSGLLLVAKGEKEKKRLQEIFKKRKVLKVYTALVVGGFKEKEGLIEGYVVRDRKDHRKRRFVKAMGERVKEKHKRLAISKYRIVKNYRCEIFKGRTPNHAGFGVEDEFNRFSLLQIKILTGRTHQIRVQMAHLHHPVVGDKLYGGKKMKEINKFLDLKRQFLHASELSFFDPWEKKKVEIFSSLPDDLSQILIKLK